MNSTSSVHLQGPSLIPPHATHAVIFLHGFGADGHDLAPLAEPLITSLGKLAETTAVFCPHAPQTIPGYQQGRQWFRDMGWTFNDPSGIAQAAHLLEEFMAHLTATHNIPRQHMALIGFSQGGMTALYSTPTFSNAPAAVISHSGAISVAPPFNPNAAKPAMLFLHGQNDDVLPADRSVEAERTFAQHGYTTHIEILPHLGHGFNGQSLAHISVFLQTVWNTEQPA